MNRLQIAQQEYDKLGMQLMKMPCDKALQKEKNRIYYHRKRLLKEINLLKLL